MYAPNYKLFFHFLQSSHSKPQKKSIQKRPAVLMDLYGATYNLYNSFLLINDDDNDEDKKKKSILSPHVWFDLIEKKNEPDYNMQVST